MNTCTRPYIWQTGANQLRHYLAVVIHGTDNVYGAVAVG